jgi:hypothetical protein
MYRKCKFKPKQVNDGPVRAAHILRPTVTGSIGQQHNCMPSVRNESIRNRTFRTVHTDSMQILQ